MKHWKKKREQSARCQVESSLLYSQKNKDTDFLGVERARGESGWEYQRSGTHRGCLVTGWVLN